MGAAVSITRLDLTAWELRKAASGEKNSGGASDTCACTGTRWRGPQNGGRNLRHGPSNLAGLGAPLQRRGTGRASQSQIARSRIETDGAAAGRIGRACRGRPRPAVHGVVRWRRVDLRDELQRRFGVALHERSVGKILTKLGYRKLSVRPRHPQADEEAQ